MVADATGVASFVIDAVVGVAVAATEAIGATAITAAVSVIIRAVVAVTCDSSPFTAGCLELLLSVISLKLLLFVIEEPFAAIESYYFEVASV